jgi:hypothetical protein
MRRQECIICRKPLISGIIVNGKKICKCCEDRLTKADMSTDFYQYYINCIKKSIVKVMLKGEDIRCQSYRS